MAPKVLFKDIVPYDLPSSLTVLRGPKFGVIELPLSVHWGPQREFDLSSPSDLEAAYQALVREGTAKDQEAFLNKALLRRVWPELMLPERCRRLWEERFPGLAG